MISWLCYYAVSRSTVCSDPVSSLGVVESTVVQCYAKKENFSVTEVAVCGSVSCGIAGGVKTTRCSQNKNYVGKENTLPS